MSFKTLCCGLLAMLVSGCTPTSGGDAPAAERVRPIDAVREEIVALRTQLTATLAATDAVVAESGPNARGRRQELVKEMAATGKVVESLRTHARELNERAEDYLTLWGPRVDYIGPQGAPQAGVNLQRQQVKDRFDRMVAALIKARDQMLPLHTNLQQIQGKLTGNLSSAEFQALKPETDRAATEIRGVMAHLTEALAALDELRATAPR